MRPLPQSLLCGQQAGAEPLPLTVDAVVVTWIFLNSSLGAVAVLSVPWVLHAGTLPRCPLRPQEPLHSWPSWPREGQGSYSQQDGFLLVAVDLWESLATKRRSPYFQWSCFTCAGRRLLSERLQSLFLAFGEFTQPWGGAALSRL